MQKILKDNPLLRPFHESAKQGIIVSKQLILKLQALKPATLAVLIQGLALILVVMAYLIAQFITARYFSYLLSPSILALVLCQAAISVFFSIKAVMASWWKWIHAVFPLALWAMAQWQIPQEIYLFGFLLSMSLYWTTFRTQVPFYPSRPVIWQHVLDMIPHGKPTRMIDIGSGIGDLVMHIAHHRHGHGSQFTGIEIAVLPWLISYIRARLKPSSAVFLLGNYLALDFADYDVVFAYLSPAAMLELWEKAQREMTNGSLLISCEFEIPGTTPSFHIPANHASSQLYVWKIEK